MFVRVQGQSAVILALTTCALTGIGIVSNAAPAWNSDAATAPKTMQEKQRRLVARLTGHEAYDGNGASRFTGRGTRAERRAAAELLIDELEQRGLPAERQTYKLANRNVWQDLILSPYRGVNVVSLLRATNGSSRYVLLGAHYDTHPDCPGAVDNASGVALVMAVAESLAKLDERNVNFLIVFFDQEEEENVGSRAFIEHMESEDWTLHSAHTVDMVGWDADGDRAIEIEKPTPQLEALYRAAAEARDVVFHITGVNASDHQSFRDAGFPAVGITGELVSGDAPPHKDTPADTFDTVDFEFLASTTGVVMDVMKTIARTSQTERQGQQ